MKYNMYMLLCINGDPYLDFQSINLDHSDRETGSDACFEM